MAVETKEEIEAKTILNHPLVNRDKLFKLAGINKNTFWNNKYHNTKVPAEYWEKIVVSFKNLTKDLRGL